MLTRKSVNSSLPLTRPETVDFINQLIEKNTHSKTKKILNLVYSLMFGLIASKYIPSKYPKTVMSVIALLMYIIGRKIGNRDDGGLEGSGEDTDE